ncbi:hypothetical protein LTR09_004855 [Extremus antarcticus]|uniref:O-methyltransferase dimerisation domain-containing protein n=1 Tax=Extremus antarcticus TaxID=702011 RepID=A0AAJ0DHD1_9PEZI|nr:hypothetical protein LTR09_004855 [Extremus antarcticus]
MIGVDLGIFGLLQERSPQTKEELARASKCDEVLMGRILATLVSFSILNQLDVNSFAATPVCATLADPKYQAWLDSAVRISSCAWTATPDFLRETGYQNPSSNTKTAFAKGYGYPDGVPFFRNSAGTS